MKKIVIIAASVITVFSIVIGLSIYIDDLKNKNVELQQKIETIDPSDAAIANQNFLKKFFDYGNTGERYENIDILMSADGYQSIFPSGFEIPSSESVESRVITIKDFEHSDDRENTSFYNTLKIKTTFNDVSNTQEILVFTKLVYKEEKWLVDFVEILNSL